VKLYFKLGGDIVIIKILGKKIYFSNALTGCTKFLPIEPFINQTWGEGKLKELEEHLKGIKEGEEMKDYVINEFRGQGFKFQKEE